MKRTLKTLVTAAAVTGLCFGAAVVSQAAWSGISYSNKCNTSDDLPTTGGSAVLVDDAADRAPDGTAYIKSGETLLHDNGTDTLDIAFELLYSSKDLGTFATWETDIKFTQDGTGFSIRNDSGAKAGKINSTIIYGNNTIRFSSVSGTKICDASADKWYHIQLVGVYGAGQDNAIMNISVSEYQTDGSLKLVGTAAYPGGKYGEVLRNDNAARRFAFTPGVCVDNVTFNEMPPKALKLTGDSSMKAGESQQFSAQLYADTAKTLPLSGMDIVYELYNADATEYLISDDITITSTGGLLTVSGSAEAQSFVVRAKCVDFPEVYDDIVVNVESVAMLEFIGASFDNVDDPKTLVNLKFKQGYENEGDITFVAAVFDADDKLMTAYTKNLAYRDQQAGDLTVTLNKELPAAFDKDTCTIKVFAWTKTID